jgi:hypothetical protein
MNDEDCVVTTCLKRISRQWVFVALCTFACVVSAGEMSPDNLIAEITNITYRNHDEYLVEITLGKWSGGILDPERLEISFSAQSEVLGQWIELARRRADGPKKSIRPEGRIVTITEIVSIPLSSPYLFRNHEGDVNMRFIYKLESTGTRFAGDRGNTGESAYWVTPRTNRWVLREGM